MNRKRLPEPTNCERNMCAPVVADGGMERVEETSFFCSIHMQATAKCCLAA